MKIPAKKVLKQHEYHIGKLRQQKKLPKATFWRIKLEKGKIMLVGHLSRHKSKENVILNRLKC